MFVTIILTCLAMTASAVPVTPGMATIQQQSQTQIGDQPVQRDLVLDRTAGTQIVVQVQPNVQQPQPGIPQQQGVGAQGGPQYMFPMQHQTWAPQGLPMYMPYQPSVQGYTPVHNQPAQPQHPLFTPDTATMQQRGDLPVQRDPALDITPGTQVLVQVQPNAQQPQPGIPQQQGAGALGGQFLLPTQQQTWAPQGIPMFNPYQPSIQGPVHNMPSQPQQPMMFPQYGYFPAFPSPQGSQMPFAPQPFAPQSFAPQSFAPQPFAPQSFAPQFNQVPYGFPMIYQAPPPQFPVVPPPAAPVAPVEPAVAPVPAAPEPKTPNIVYMFQPPMLGGFSSEELQMASRIAQMLLPSIQANMPAEAAMPASGSLMGISQGSVPQTERVPVPGALPGAKNTPAGLEHPRQDTAPIPAPVVAPVQPSHQRNEPGTVDTKPPAPLVNNLMAVTTTTTTTGFPVVTP